MKPHMNEKEKRKGRPRSHALRVMLILAIGAVLLLPVIVMLLKPPDTPYQYQSSFRLTAFDIAEDQNLIALSWSDGQSSILVTQNWTELQMGETRSRQMVEALREDAIGRVDLHPQQNALITVSDNSYNPYTLYRNHRRSMPFNSRVEDIFYSSTGEWLVAIDPWSVTMRTSDLNAAPSGFSYSRVYQSHAAKAVTNIDDTLIAVAEQRSANVPWGIRVLRTSDNTQVASLPDVLPNVVGMAFHPESKSLAITTGVAVFLLDLEEGKMRRLPLSTKYTPLGQLAYDPTGRWLIGDAGANHSNLPRGFSLYIYDFATDPGWPDPVFAGVGTDAFTFQIVGERIIIGQANNLLRVIRWDGQTWVRTSEWSVTPQ